MLVLSDGLVNPSVWMKSSGSIFHFFALPCDGMNI